MGKSSAELSRKSVKASTCIYITSPRKEEDEKMFFGYTRPDGSVGVRNHALIMATASCSLEPAKRISSLVRGTVAVNQGPTCEPDRSSINQLVGMGKNPNVVGVLLIATGCEGEWVEESAERIAESNKPVGVFRIQKEGGATRTIEKAAKLAQRIVQEPSEIRREPHDLSELTIVVKCGGTDPTSGIAANPATGVAADMLIDAGGTVVMSETGDLLGTADILARRAVSPEVAKKVYEVIHAAEKRYRAQRIFYRDRSTHGHIVGGLTTQVEKSLGALLKGGTRPLQDVLENSRRVLETPVKKGFNLQDTPNFPDVSGVTAMLATGAQIVVMTTGLGAAYGHAIAPVIRVTGNPKTYVNMEDTIDINAGTIIEGKKSIREIGEEIFDMIIQVASGKKTKVETLGYEDFCIEPTGYNGLSIGAKSGLP